MTNGWIKLYRELLDKAIWELSTPEQKTILVTLLLMANHEVKDWEWKGKRFVCQPGQLITSLEKIAKEAGNGISIQNVRTAIVRFEKFGFLTNESTKQNRLITICNWGCYQQANEQDNKQPNNQLTNDQQTANNQLTTNKNDKNVRMKEDIDIGAKRIAFVPPAIGELNFYIQEKGYSVNAEQFFDFYESKGWFVGKNKMKDWKAAVRNWARNEINNNGKREQTGAATGGLAEIPGTSAKKKTYKGTL